MRKSPRARTCKAIRKRKRVRKCVFCGSTRKIEIHHVAGRLFKFTVPLCHECHVDMTVGLKRLKIHTSRKVKSLLDPCRATIFFLWKLFEQFEGGNS